MSPRLFDRVILPEGPFAYPYSFISVQCGRQESVPALLCVLVQNDSVFVVEDEGQS